MTDLVFILDMSGSMMGLKEDTIGGYNSILEENKKDDDKCYVTTIFFDHDYKIVHNRVDIKEVQPITTEYKPRGTTALFDAIGRTLNTLAEEKLDKVVVTIITDGLENASKEWNGNTIKNLIEEKKKEGWLISFIGANIIDFDRFVDSIGIDKRLAKTYSATKTGTDRLYSVISDITSFVKKDNVNLDAAYEFTVQSLQDIE